MLYKMVQNFNDFPNSLTEKKGSETCIAIFIEGWGGVVPDSYLIYEYITVARQKAVFLGIVQ